MAADPDLDQATRAPRTSGILDEASSEDQLQADLTQALRNLEETKGVFGSAVVDRQGFPIAWNLKGGTQQASVGLLGATLRTLLLRASTILDLGDFSSGLVKFDKGLLGVFEVGVDELFLVVLAGSQANVMDLLVDTESARRELRAILGAR